MIYAKQVEITNNNANQTLTRSRLNCKQHESRPGDYQELVSDMRTDETCDQQHNSVLLLLSAYIPLSDRVGPPLVVVYPLP